MKAITNLLLYIFIVSLLSCGLIDGDDDMQVPMEAPLLGIAGAEMLVVFQDDENDGGRFASNHEGNLYKLMADGSFEKVKYVNPDGSDIDPNVAETNIEVSQIMQLSSQVLLLNGSFSLYDTLGNAKYYSQILVRKSDGAIFDFPDVHVYAEGHVSRHDPIQKDESGFLYFTGNIFTRVDEGEPGGPTSVTSEEGALIRLDISSITNPSYENVLPTGQTAYSFMVDSEGNVFYENVGDGSMGMKIIKKEGGIISLDDHMEFPWKGTNGYLYAFMGDGDVHKLEVNGGELVQDLVWDNQDDMGHGYSTYGFRIKKQNSILLISSDGSPGGSSSTDHVGLSWEFNELSNTLEIVDVPVNPGRVIRSGEYAYMFGGTKLYKMRISDNTFFNITTDEYEFYSLGQGAGNELIFSALRYADGKKVLGKLTSSDEVEIVDEENDREATYLVRLD